MASNDERARKLAAALDLAVAPRAARSPSPASPPASPGARATGSRPAAAADAALEPSRKRRRDNGVCYRFAQVRRNKKDEKVVMMKKDSKN